jgi:aspartate kinase
MKFGGSSVADNDKLKIVANKIIDLYQENNVVVVVSAQGKTTDRLLKEAYELSSVPSERELDVLLSCGEQISISKLSILLNELGYKSISLTGWQAGIFTNNVNQNASIENIDVSRINKELSERKIVIIAGFQGINEKLDITTLGRGGSDTTAVAISAALKARHCYIFSDVDGVYTADPNKISSAKKIGELSYVEMLDISDEGAKVLHDRCIEIGEKFKIPIETKSTFNNKNGSVITDKIEEKIVKSIVKNDDILLINMKKLSNSAISITELYEHLIKSNILPIHFFANNNDDKYDVSFLVKASYINKLDKILENDINGFEYSKNKISRIAIIGYGITTDNITISKIIDELKGLNFDIYSIDITNTKIILTLNKFIDNYILEDLHQLLF